MKKARIVIGANYGDEGKGTVVAHYTKHAEGKLLNVLTNGGAQRGHSILVDEGSITFQHFGSGTYHGADNCYSRFFILNPMQFANEYNNLLVKPKHIYRDIKCRWTTPYDSMINLITEELQKRHASCGMGIWNTIKRYNNMKCIDFDDFIAMEDKTTYLISVRQYYEKQIDIPSKWKNIWMSPTLMLHFINDCMLMSYYTEAVSLKSLDYDNLIFENGQGLLLCDTGKDTYDTTPTNTGILYSLELLKEIPDVDITAHYVTRPYLTRHGDGELQSQNTRNAISGSIEEDRTNHFNQFQGDFRYGSLDIPELHQRIIDDSKGMKFELEVTHCDEMDRVKEFKEKFSTVNVYDSARIK